MDHDVPHDLPLSRAQGAAHQALADYAARFARYSPTIHWRNESEAEIRFTVKGATLSGELQVLPDRFHMHLGVPFLLRPFAGRAVQMIDSQVRALIAKAKANPA